MQKYLQIVNIDGTEGSGKTTQIQLLKSRLRLLGSSVLVNHLDDNIESARQVLTKTLSFLKEAEYGVVINDGSIARAMAVDLVDGISKETIIEKYRDVFFIQNSLYHQFGTSNILIVMDDILEAQKRLARNKKILGIEDTNTLDLVREKKITEMMQNFDSLVISTNMYFHSIEVGSTEKMNDVCTKIYKYLLDNFEIKKPS